MAYQKLHSLTASLSSLVRRRKSKSRSKTKVKSHLQLPNLPAEILIYICTFLSSPDEAVLAVTCSKLYLTLHDDLSKISAWEANQCSRRLHQAGYFLRQQLPCFTCAEMHPISHFYSPELHQPLPQCIATGRMWRCGCSSLIATNIQAGFVANGNTRYPYGGNEFLRTLFDPCASCRNDEGLSCIGPLDHSSTHARGVGHTITFTVPHIGLDTAVLRRAITARCATFDLPLCRHMSLSDSRVLATFDDSCHGLGAACPPTCLTQRNNANHVKPLTSCAMAGCGLRVGIAQQYLGASAAAAAANADNDDSWRVTITISRPLPNFSEHLRKDPHWGSLAFTDREFVDRFPRVATAAAEEKTAKGQSGGTQASLDHVLKRSDVKRMVWSYLIREGTWEWETRMLKHFWNVRRERRRGEMAEA